MRAKQADPGGAVPVLGRYDAARGEETDPPRRHLGPSSPDAHVPVPVCHHTGPEKEQGPGDQPGLGSHPHPDLPQVSPVTQDKSTQHSEPRLPCRKVGAAVPTGGSVSAEGVSMCPAPCTQ